MPGRWLAHCVIVVIAAEGRNEGGQGQESVWFMGEPWSSE